MTSRERVFTALAHQQPDRCPADFWAETTTIKKLYEYFHVTTTEELCDIFHSDIQFVDPDSTFPQQELLPDGSWYNHLGQHIRFFKNNYCEYEEYASFPLAEAETIEELEKYERWPDASDFDWKHYSEKIGALHEKRVIKIFAGGIFEVAWGYRGLEQFLTDMITEPEMAHYILDKVSNYWCGFIRNAMEAAGDKIDIVYTYDDIATQISLMMSPDMLREFVKPYHNRVNQVIKGYGKKIMYHSCGAVTPAIGVLKEYPIDILNPLQPLAKGMDFAQIKKDWGEVLCFHGGIDIQKLLPYGTVEEVRAEVKRVISILGQDGGYILAPAHKILNETPVENIIAMYDPALR